MHRLRPLLGWAAPLVCLAWLTLSTGCATVFPPAQTAALLGGASAGLPRQVERTEVPFFPQTPYHCGPAALATVLKQVGIEATPEQLTQAVFVPDREGALQTEMLAGARRAGAVAVPLPKQLVAMLQEVAAGHAVVVLQNLGLDIAPRWHYAVVVGYDLNRGEVVLRSGTVQREVMALGTFEHTWTRAGSWAFVALPPGQLPAVAQELDALQATIAFERVATPAAAAQAYEAALKRWPANLVAAMGLGNSRFATGDLNAAAAAFEAAARQHNTAPAWNNLAQTRLKLGQRPGALEAGERAVQRAEAGEPQWLDAARATLRQVLESPVQR